MSVTFWGFVRRFWRRNGRIRKVSKNDAYTATSALSDEDQSTVCCRDCCCCYCRVHLVTRTYDWRTLGNWCARDVDRWLIGSGWRLTDGRCILTYSSSWNALGALKLNQMSTTLHSNTQTTPTTSVVYTSNKNTQRIRLDDNSFGNTRSLVENSVTPIDLRLSYNVKSDIYDNQLLCLIVRLLCLSI